MSYYETGQAGMGVHPWEDFDAYIRNSPIRYIDKIQTPVLLIHEDADAFPIQQSEIVFTALYRLGKRARLVEYLGEGDTVEGKANLLDLWEHITAWFGAYLAESFPE